MPTKFYTGNVDVFKLNNAIHHSIRTLTKWVWFVHLYQQHFTDRGTARSLFTIIYTTRDGSS